MVGGVSGSSSAMTAAASGLQQGMARFGAASERIIAAPDDVGAIVDQKLASAAVEASAKVVKTIDDLTGTLIDTIA